MSERSEARGRSQTVLLQRQVAACLPALGLARLRQDADLSPKPKQEPWTGRSLADWLCKNISFANIKTIIYGN